MSGNKGKIAIDEHINKLKYRFNYQINETPKYKAIIDDNLEFDEVPMDVHSTQDGQPMPNAGGGSDAFLEEQGNEEEVVAPEEEAPTPDDTPVPEPTNAPAPAGDTGLEPEAPMPEEPEVPMPEETPMGNEFPEETPQSQEPQENIDKEVNQIQNDVIKHNIEAMKNLQSKLMDMESVNAQLMSQLETLNGQVEEVKEPTNVEKMMAKKDVSYPYYFNLNDFWQDNWFDKEREKAKEAGIRELPDGTFVADFDDLPTHNSMDVDDSFNIA